MGAAIANAGATQRVDCPVCFGRGRLSGRAFGRLRDARHACGACGGTAAVSAARLAPLAHLRAQMQHVADLMQSGDADRAAEASRVAFRLARSIMP